MFHTGLSLTLNLIREGFHFLLDPDLYFIATASTVYLLLLQPGIVIQNPANFSVQSG